MKTVAYTTTPVEIDGRPWTPETLMGVLSELVPIFPMIQDAEQSSSVSSPGVPAKRMRITIEEMKDDENE